MKFLFLFMKRFYLLSINLLKAACVQKKEGKAGHRRQAAGLGVWTRLRWLSLSKPSSFLFLEALPIEI
jgi:hypothetical protein